MKPPKCPSLSQLLSSLKGSCFAVGHDMWIYLTATARTAAEYVAEMKEQEEVGLLTAHLHRNFKLYQLRLWQRYSICFNGATRSVNWLCPTCTYVLLFFVHYKFVSTIMGLVIIDILDILGTTCCPDFSLEGRSIWSAIVLLPLDGKYNWHLGMSKKLFCSFHTFLDLDWYRLFW